MCDLRPRILLLSRKIFPLRKNIFEQRIILQLRLVPELPGQRIIRQGQLRKNRARIPRQCPVPIRHAEGLRGREIRAAVDAIGVAEEFGCGLDVFV
jgi:hypothetical protein